jgi:hypothetical protein
MSQPDSPAHFNRLISQTFILLDGVIGIFNFYNPSDRTTTLRSTQPVTGIITTNIDLGVQAAAAKD